VTGCDDILVKVEPLLKIVGDWGKFLGQDTEESVKKELRFHERSGRSLGDESFLLALE
jgi:putative transposase